MSGFTPVFLDFAGSSANGRMVMMHQMRHTFDSSHHSPNSSSSDICPNCGKFVKSDQIDEYTGWCGRCSSADPYVQAESYLARNADRIEYQLSTGMSLSDALQAAITDLRPFCLCCGAVINRGPQNAIFCSKNKRCQQAKNRYKHLVYVKGMTKPFALATVLSELGKSS